MVDRAVARLRLRPAGGRRAASPAAAGYDRVVATGYGRHAAAERFGADVVTEIKAYALGAARLFPQARSMLDIGGQDTKVISLAPGGRVARLRDERQVRRRHRQVPRGDGPGARPRARGAGRGRARAPTGGVTISSMCTVFAESEVTGLVHRGEDRGRASPAACTRRSRGARSRRSRRVGAAPRWCSPAASPATRRWCELVTRRLRRRGTGRAGAADGRRAWAPPFMPCGPEGATGRTNARQPRQRRRRPHVSRSPRERLSLRQ